MTSSKIKKETLKFVQRAGKDQETQRASTSTAFEPMPSQETYVRLKVISDSLSAEEVTGIVGLACDKSWRPGDKRGRTIIVEKQHGWVINSALPKSADLPSQLDELLARLAPCAVKLRSLSDVSKLEISCVVYSDTPPALNFDKRTIEAIAAMGAGLDIDVYVGN